MYNDIFLRMNKWYCCCCCCCLYVAISFKDLSPTLKEELDAHPEMAEVSLPKKQTSIKVEKKVSSEHSEFFSSLEPFPMQTSHSIHSFRTEPTAGVVCRQRHDHDAIRHHGRGPAEICGGLPLHQGHHQHTPLPLGHGQLRPAGKIPGLRRRRRWFVVSLIPSILAPHFEALNVAVLNWRQCVLLMTAMCSVNDGNVFCFADREELPVPHVLLQRDSGARLPQAVRRRVCQVSGESCFRRSFARWGFPLLMSLQWCFAF